MIEKITISEAMNRFPQATAVAYLYAESTDSNQCKIKKNDLLSGILKRISLTMTESNIVGDYDGLESGYGFYNNTNSSSGQYAPAGTAGIFIRFKLITDDFSTTFFFPSAYGEKAVWYRIKGKTCVKS
ncbi:hypothetical protein [uncultured Bacteroides sp.]|uniref:hypothetical protein n=1 Tax=uncultured Bacteroides sp. TaxID=162156 RepID=UPI0026137E6A|nr:hypothetical protein [uncultured Bacteroides sp.]